jgi:hypothetical protein
MQDIIVYMIVGLAVVIAIIAAVKQFFGKNDNVSTACEGCTLKESCKTKVVNPCVK